MAELEDSNFPRTNQHTDAHLAEMIEILAEVLAKHDAEAIVMFGTLLGSVRAGELIAGDKDIDLCVMDSFVPKSPQIVEELCALGFSQIRTSPEILSLRWKTAYCDFMLLRLEWRGARLHHYLLPRSCFLNYGRAEINGHPWRTPSNPEMVLRRLYGPDWMTPRSNSPALPNLFIPRVLHDLKTMKYYLFDRFTWRHAVRSRVMHLVRKFHP